jgi:hypothetical protein
MGWTRRTHGAEEKLMQSFYRTPEGNNRSARPRSRWEDDTFTDDRDQWRVLVNMVINLQVPSNTGNFLTSQVIISFTRKFLLHGVSFKKLNFHSGVVGSKLDPLGTSATSGLLYLPRVIVRMENLVE